MKKLEQLEQELNANLDKIESMSKILNGTDSLLSVGITASLFKAASDSLLENENDKFSRWTVRSTFEMIKKHLEEKYGQSLFDEEFDNKLYKE